MSYIEHSLGRSETLLYRARYPWFYAACAWALLLGSLAGCLWAYAVGHGEVALGLVAAGVVLFVTIMGPLWTTEIGVTNQRLIFKRGLIWRSTHELQLRAIEEVNLEQDLLGRIFDCGRLRLHGTGRGRHPPARARRSHWAAQGFAGRHGRRQPGWPC